MEGLVLPGAKFVLNVLGGDKVGAVSKQLLKPFAPGEERFGGLGTEESSACGGARVLKDAVRLIVWELCILWILWILLIFVDFGRFCGYYG